MNGLLNITVGLGAAAAAMLIGMACADAETPSRAQGGTPQGLPNVTLGVTPSATPGVAPTSPPGGEVPATTLGELLASPDRYNDREILLEGFYFHGWESNLLSEGIEPSGLAEGHLWPQGHRIWVEGSIPTEVYERLHQQEIMGPPERYGKVRIKGTFEYGDRYGHLGGFEAQIVASEAEGLPWAPPSVVQ